MGSEMCIRDSIPGRGAAARPAPDADPLAVMDAQTKRELVELFLQEAQRLRDKIHSAHEDADAPQAAIAAHTLAGASSYFDAADLRQICRGMEAAAKLGDLSQVGDTLPELDRACAQVSDRLLRLW